MKVHQAEQYVEGDKRTRFIFFAFFAVWIIGGSILKWFAEEELKLIEKTAKNASVTACDFSNIMIWHFVLPMTFFFLVGFAYLFWMGINTFQAGVYPPTGIKVPFKKKVRTGNIAKLIAAGYLIAGFCDFVLVVSVIWFSRCT